MWLYSLFPRILNMSITVGIIIVLVLLVRLPLRKAPKIFSYALWAVVLFKLLCPLSLESPVSVVPNVASITSDQIEAIIPSVAIETPADKEMNRTAETENPDHPVYVLTEIGGNIIIALMWLAGIAAMLVYSLISFVRLKRRLIGAVPLRENIYLADHIASPFVIGVVRPRIYLPSALSEQERSFIILHEQTHIRRLDHVVKLAAFFALSVHWFNPLVWVAFICYVRDMEMSCDEAVMKKIDGDIRAGYSTSLLRFATGRQIIAGTPLAFGEGDTKGRIRNVMNYKKPAFWVVVIAAVAAVAVCISLVANPQRTSMEWAKTLNFNNILSIELVAMSGNENERYRKFDRLEFPAIVSLINDSRGSYVASPEVIAGGTITFYITTKDGIRHTYGNSANLYLVIDRESYTADYGWLSSWEYDRGYGRGNAPLPEGFSENRAFSFKGSLVETKQDSIIVSIVEDCDIGKMNNLVEVRLNDAVRFIGFENLIPGRPLLVTYTNVQQNPASVTAITLEQIDIGTAEPISVGDFDIDGIPTDFSDDEALSAAAKNVQDTFIAVVAQQYGVDIGKQPCVIQFYRGTKQGDLWLIHTANKNSSFTALIDHKTGTIIDLFNE